MKFTVPDLKKLSKAVRKLSARERTAASAMLHRRQPDFCEIIDDVGMDPRCVRAARYCTLICALAFRQAEETFGRRLPKFPGYIIKEVMGCMIRGEEAHIGKRACGYRKRIFRYILVGRYFDEDDTAWLRTMISAFLFIVEKSLWRARHDEVEDARKRLTGF